MQAHVMRAFRRTAARCRAARSAWRRSAQSSGRARAAACAAAPTPAQCAGSPPQPAAAHGPARTSQDAKRQRAGVSNPASNSEKGRAAMMDGSVAPARRTNGSPCEPKSCAERRSANSQAQRTPEPCKVQVRIAGGTQAQLDAARAPLRASRRTAAPPAAPPPRGAAAGRARGAWAAPPRARSPQRSAQSLKGVACACA
jgi:hypothetical protein